MDLSRAQKLFQMGGAISAIEIQIADPFQSTTVYKEIENVVSDVIVEEWQSQNQQLLGDFKKSKQLFVYDTVFRYTRSNPRNSKRFGCFRNSKIQGNRILKAMGATKKSASRIFVFQGLILGIIGSIIGSLAGILLIRILFQNVNSDNSGLVIEYKNYKHNYNMFYCNICRNFCISYTCKENLLVWILTRMEAIKNGWFTN